MNISKELEKFGLTNEEYEKLLDYCSDKVDRISDLDWSEISDMYGLGWNPDSLRKGAATNLVGGVFVKKYLEEKYSHNSTNRKMLEEVQKKTEEMRKERIKLQTLNIERNRLDRQEARQELFYEYVRDAIATLPLPKFKAIPKEWIEGEITYVVTLADIHYGAEFVSERNEYSSAIVRERFMYLLEELRDFIEKKEVKHLHIVNLGDTIQGCLRVSDIKLNESSVVRSVVEASQLIGHFLNELSTYVNVTYYHVPKANHSQIRPLGTKANVLPEEDLEYVIGHYIAALCSENQRINIRLAENEQSYLKLDVDNFAIYTKHGHDIKNISTELKDLCALTDESIDYLLLGHYHCNDIVTSSEKCTYDSEVLISPSFMGSDPYSDSLYKGAKAAVKIYGFDDIYGHIEDYKIILN